MRELTTLPAAWHEPGTAERMADYIRTAEKHGWPLIGPHAPVKRRPARKGKR